MTSRPNVRTIMYTLYSMFKVKTNTFVQIAMTSLFSLCDYNNIYFIYNIFPQYIFVEVLPSSVDFMQKYKNQQNSVFLLFNNHA